MGAETCIRPRRGGAALLAIVLASALLLALLAVRSTISAGLTVAHGRTIEEVRLGRPVTPAALAAAAVADRRAAAWFEPARNRTDAAAMLIARGEPGGGQAPAQAERLVTAALAAAPAQPYNWARLAYLRTARGDIPGAVAAWKMSVATGRYVPNLMRPRLILGLRLLAAHPLLNGDLRDQIELFAQAMPGELARLARALGAEAVVRAALAPDRAALGAFDRRTSYLVPRGDMRARRASP